MTDGSSCTGREGDCSGGESRSSSQLSEKESGFLERVAGRVAERKGVFFCRDEKKIRQHKGVEKKRQPKGVEKKAVVRVCLVKAERRKIGSKGKVI